MGKKNVGTLGIKISGLNIQQILEEIKKYLKTEQPAVDKNVSSCFSPLIIFTPNPEIVVRAQKDDGYRKIINSAQINIPDGWGLVWASRLLGEPLSGRIAGTDLLEKLAEQAAKYGFIVGLIGGGPKIAVKTLECLKRKHPKLLGWAEEGPALEVGSGNPLVYGEVKNWVARIREKKTDMVFVGMGAPKQEYFIDSLRREIDNEKETKPLVLMAVGGAFDYLSGEVSRAPKKMRDFGLEWIYRLVRQPWRIKRQIALLEFICIVLRLKKQTFGR